MSRFKLKSVRETPIIQVFAAPFAEKGTAQTEPPVEPAIDSVGSVRRIDAAG